MGDSNRVRVSGMTVMLLWLIVDDFVQMIDRLEVNLLVSAGLQIPGVQAVINVCIL